MANIIDTIKARKQKLSEISDYNHNPIISVVVESFNTSTLHPGFIELMVKSFRKGFDEIIVCEDGAVDNTREKWKGLLDHANDFIICSNDLCEILAYDRAINLAKSDIVCLCQDDDIYPEDGKWISDALALFDAHEDLAILGGYEGQFPNIKGGSSQPMVKMWGGIIPFIDPKTKLHFMHTCSVNLAPMFIRKSMYKKVNGFNADYAIRGHIGDAFDSELCYRMWNAGYKVGSYYIHGLKTDVGDVEADVEQGDHVRTGVTFTENFSSLSWTNFLKLFDSFDTNNLIKMSLNANKSLIMDKDSKGWDKYHSVG